MVIFRTALSFRDGYMCHPSSRQASWYPRNLLQKNQGMNSSPGEASCFSLRFWKIGSKRVLALAEIHLGFIVEMRGK